MHQVKYSSFHSKCGWDLQIKLTKDLESRHLVILTDECYETMNSESERSCVLCVFEITVPSCHHPRSLFLLHVLSVEVGITVPIFKRI